MRGGWIRQVVFLSMPALVLGLIGTEVVLRALRYRPYYLDGGAFVPSKNGELVYELRPGWRGLYAGVPTQINSMGWRGIEPRRGNSEETFRIVVIGDFIAFGQGVEEGETLADQLRASLEKKRGVGGLVVNLGVPGYNTCQEYWRFREHGLFVRPHVAVLLYVENDTAPPVFHVRSGKVLPPDVRPGLWGDLAAQARKQSRVYNLVWTRWQVIM